MYAVRPSSLLRLAIYILVNVNFQCFVNELVSIQQRLDLNEDLNFVDEHNERPKTTQKMESVDFEVKHDRHKDKDYGHMSERCVLYDNPTGFS
ncbi:hypothetical protein I312_103713 [Cryptococcus bacillisporus CA1280]|uniref:uncharacterized protein n=1 Tax=Cryptococcus bacillisporus CA1280 TaxID=1296109 RepID=UPI00336651A6